MSELLQESAPPQAHISLSPKSSRGYWFAILAMICWAIASVLTKAATGKLPPQLLFATELAAGTLVLWIWVLATDPFHIKLQTAAKLAWPGLLQPGLAFSLTFVALQWTTISNETLIWSTESVIMLLLGAIFLRRRLSRPLISLSIVAFFGVALMALAGNSDSVSSHRIVLANSMIALGVLAACAYTFLAERALIHLPEEQLFALHQTAGLLVAVVFALIERRTRGANEPKAAWTIWSMVCIAGVLLFALPFVFYLRAIRALGSAASSQFLPLVPILTAVLAAFFLGEHLNLTQWGGVAIVVASVALIGWLQRKTAME